VKSGYVFDPRELKWRPLDNTQEQNDPFAGIVVPEKHITPSIGLSLSSSSSSSSSSSFHFVDV
jgi:hypothetical protein